MVVSDDDDAEQSEGHRTPTCPPLDSVWQFLFLYFQTQELFALLLNGIGDTGKKVFTKTDPGNLSTTEMRTNSEEERDRGAAELCNAFMSKHGLLPFQTWPP